MGDNEDTEFGFITRSAERLRENPEALTAFLESLRKSLIRIAVSVLCCSVAGYVFARPILKYFHSIVGAELAAYGRSRAFPVGLCLYVRGAVLKEFGGEHPAADVFAVYRRWGVAGIAMSLTPSSRMLLVTSASEPCR